MGLVHDQISRPDFHVVAHELAEELTLGHRTVAPGPAAVERLARGRELHGVGPDRDFRGSGRRGCAGERDCAERIAAKYRSAAGRFERAPQQVDGADERGDEAVRRRVVELDGRADLLDDPLVEDRHAVGDGERLLLVVGHKDRGDAELSLQREQLAAHVDAQLRVEIGKRLVEQQHLGLDRDGASERDTLLLATRELARAARPEFAEPDEVERGGGPALDLRAREPAFLQPECHVLPHRHMRPQGVVLEHHPDIALPRGHAGHVLTADANRTRLRLEESREQAQQSGLAGTRRAEEGEELSRLDRDADVGQHARLSVREGDVPELHPDLLECFAHCGGSTLIPQAMRWMSPAVFARAPISR